MATTAFDNRFALEVDAADPTVPTAGAMPVHGLAGTPESRRQAFKDAHAIMTLAGFERSAALAPFEEAIIRGDMTFDAAAKSILDDVRALVEANKR